MKLLVTGATGLIGRRLVVDRLARGDQVLVVSRDAARAARLFAAEANPKVKIVLGNPAAPGAWQEAVAGCDAVVNLAGAGIAERRWNPQVKRTLVSSRVDGTRHLVQAIGQAPASQRPRVLVSGSAVGYYGDTGPRSVDESAPAGRDFLALLTAEWEAQAKAAAELGVRVVLLRTGIVLDDRGGALEKIVKPFRFFVGGPLGSGRQLTSWIHWRDEIGLIDLAITNPRITGPLNATAPEVLSNRDFHATVGLVIGRASWLPVPKFGLRLAVGELAESLVRNQGVRPAKAIEHGYAFVHPKLEGALESLLRPNKEKEEDESRPAPRAARVEPASAANEPRPPGPIRLVAVSVDGALLRSDGTVSQGVIQACRAAQRAGCVVVPATARPPRGMRSILQTLGLSSPTINYNGAVIWNPLDEKAQYHEPLDAATAAAAVRDARAIDPMVLVAVETLDRWHTDRLDPAFAAQTSRLQPPDQIGPLDPFLARPVTQLTFIASPAALVGVMEMIRERYWKPRRVAVFRPDPSVIQVMHPLTDKGIALQRIASRMGVGREQVMAIGDGPQDAGMIEWAGFGVATADAPEAVRRLADAVVPGSDENGAARALQRYVMS